MENRIQPASVPDLTVSIVTWNSLPTIADCLNAVLAACQGISYEIIIVDNNSQDGTPQRLRELFPSIRLIGNPENRGFAAAHNQALRLARGRRMLVLNPDVILRKDTVRRVMAYLDENSEARIVGCKLVQPDGTLLLSCRRFPRLGALLGRRLPWLRSQTEDYEMRGYDHQSARKVDWISGSFMFFREKYFFDERYFLYLEDADLCREIGGVYYCPEAVAVHTAPYSSRRSLRLFLHHVRSACRYFLKTRGRMVPE